MDRNWRRNVVFRKGWRSLSIPRRWLSNLIEHPTPGRLPVLANSIPKSGTHLLLQVLKALPGIRDWGLFLASQPSFTFVEQDPGRMAAKISKMANGELAGAHLHHHQAIAQAVEDRDALMYFIYRDPRDVVVSEAHYLAHMNSWHRLHDQFKHQPDENARLRLAIEGLPASEGINYPDVGTRLARYLPWLDHPGILAVRYEDLVGKAREEQVRRIVAHWITATGFKGDVSGLHQSALDSINPLTSHTFRLGRAGGWRDAMNQELKTLFQRNAHAQLQRMGYEDP